jgi:hypothetical protein
MHHVKSKHFFRTPVKLIETIFFGGHSQAGSNKNLSIIFQSHRNYRHMNIAIFSSD